MNTDIDPRYAELLPKLTALLNECGIEKHSMTPDYLLAEYLVRCLAAYALTVTNRDTWWGIHPGTGTRPNL